MCGGKGMSGFPRLITGIFSIEPSYFSIIIGLLPQTINSSQC